MNIQKRICLSYVLKGKNFSPENALVVFSDPRGGSTWLTEMLSTIPNTAVIWEPLVVWKKSPFNLMNFNYRQFIPEHVEWKKARAVFADVITGKKINRFMARLNTVSDYKNSDRLIVKFCRANAMIPWLTAQFTFTYKPILLIRHPFAVIASQLHHGKWNYHYKGFTVPEAPYNEFYKEHEEYLKTLKTKEEYQTALWCMVNLIPLRHTGNNKKWITINYENLLLDPESQLKRIFSNWEIEMPDEIHHKISEASSTTKTGSPLSPESQLVYWQTLLSKDQIRRMKSVLSYFNCEFYNDEPMPLKSFN